MSPRSLEASLHLRLDGGASLLLHKAKARSGLAPGEAMLFEGPRGDAIVCSFLDVLNRAMRDDSGEATIAIVRAEDFDRLTAHLSVRGDTIH